MREMAYLCPREAHCRDLPPEIAFPIVNESAVARQSGSCNHSAFCSDHCNYWLTDTQCLGIWGPQKLLLLCPGQFANILISINDQRPERRRVSYFRGRKQEKCMPDDRQSGGFIPTNFHFTVLLSHI